MQCWLKILGRKVCNIKWTSTLKVDNKQLKITLDSNITYSIQQYFSTWSKLGRWKVGQMGIAFSQWPSKDSSLKCVIVSISFWLGRGIVFFSVNHKRSYQLFAQTLLRDTVQNRNFISKKAHGLPWGSFSVVIHNLV